MTGFSLSLCLVHTIVTPPSFFLGFPGWNVLHSPAILEISPPIQVPTLFSYLPKCCPTYPSTHWSIYCFISFSDTKLAPLFWMCVDILSSVREETMERTWSVTMMPCDRLCAQRMETLVAAHPTEPKSYICQPATHEGRGAWCSSLLGGSHGSSRKDYFPWGKLLYFSISANWKEQTATSASTTASTPAWGKIIRPESLAALGKVGKSSRTSPRRT